MSLENPNFGQILLADVFCSVSGMIGIMYTVTAEVAENLKLASGPNPLYQYEISPLISRLAYTDFTLRRFYRV